MKKVRLGLLSLIVALTSLPYSVMAAVDVTEINAIKGDAATIGTAVLSVLIAIFAIKVLRRVL